MPISNYPNGFAHGINVRGLPILNTYSGNVFWVDSGSGSDGHKGTFDRPFGTLDYAVGRCTANNGDLIILKAGHAETVASAGAINCDVAGINIFGLGVGADRPAFTFSDTASTITVSAASIGIKGILLKPSIDSVVSPIVVSAADCTIDVEVQDASASVECVNGILTTADADRLTVDLKYRGFIAGDACVNAIRLVGVDTARINVDFYGVASTSIVEFHTTACHDIDITGKFYNDGTSLTQNVVDTATGSTWSVQGWDGNSNASFSGGDNSSISSDDVASVSSAVSTIDGNVDSILTDTGTTIPATLSAIPQCIEKTDGEVLTGDDDLFTITGGPVRAKIVGIVTTIIGGAANGKLLITTTDPSGDTDLSAGAVAIDNDAVGTSYYNVGATSVFTPVTAGAVILDPVTVEETEFILPIGTVKFNSSAAQTGVIAWYMTFEPLSPSSTVEAAT